MPPEIVAGLMALAGAPPGVAASAGPSPPEPLGASLFAAFLAQSSPPSVPPAAPKASVAQTLTADPKQTPLDLQALPKSKTMDTLPTLSFPALPKAKAKASGLSVPAAAVHQKAAPYQRAEDGTPAPNVPVPAPALAGQAAAPPVLFAVPVLTTPAAAVPSPVAAPGPAASAVPPVQAAPERAVPGSPSRPDTPAPTSPIAAAPGQAALAQTVPAQTVPAQPAPAQFGLPLARTGAVSAPLQTVPQPKAVSLLAVKPASVTTASATASVGRALPRVPSPVSPDPQAQAAPLPADPQEVIPHPTSPAASQNATIVTVAAAAAVPLAAALPAPETPKFSPAKTTGKFLAAALKPAGENADTSTRTTPGQSQAVSVKTGVPAAAPEPVLERHAEEQKPSLTAESGINSVPTFSQAAASTETVKAGAKPLSAGDRAEVVRQAAEAVTKMPLPATTGASEQMSLQLHPKDWGSLQVSVSVAPSQNAGAAKTVTAHIVAETPQVKAALQSQTGALHQALRAAGLHLEHLTVSVKAADIKAPEVKPAAQSASAELSSGQSQADQSQTDLSGQSRSFGQPSANTGGFGANGFGAGGSQNNRQGQPPPSFSPPAEPEVDDVITTIPFRPATGRVDTHA